MKKFLTLVFITTLLFACSTDDLIEEQQNQEIEYVNLEANPSRSSSAEILEFNSAEELRDFVGSFQNEETDLLDEARIMAEQNGYYSLLYIYDTDLATLNELGIRYEDTPAVHSYDDMLHLLLNQNGEIKIADKIFRIDDEFVYEYAQGAERDIKEFLEKFNSGGINLEKGDSVEISENLLVYRHNNNESIVEDLNREATQNARGVTIYDYYNGGQFRMRSRQFDGAWWFYSSVGASTKMQERKRYWFFGWRYYWKTVKRYNRLHFTATYTASGNGYPSYVNSVEGNEYCHCNIARETYDWSVGVPIAPFFYSVNAGSGQTDHWNHEFSVTPNTVSRTINY